MAFGNKNKNKNKMAPKQAPRPAATSVNPTPNKKPAPVREEKIPAKRANWTTIGRSLQITGELTGNEDITVDGRVDGKVSLQNHSLTVGEHGHIKGEVHAKSVVVVGEVVGNITADQRIEVAVTGLVEGDICAPRVILAEGARFKGNIDMPEGTGSKPGGKLAATVDTFDESKGEKSKVLAEALESFDLE